MQAHRLFLTGLATVLIGSGAAGGVEARAVPQDAGVRDAQVLAAKIDQLLSQRWTQAKVEPAPLASDAEFLRRVYLDLAGRIPSVTETRAFLQDSRTDRRSRLVEQLLASPRYVSHFINVWRALLIPEASNNFIVRLQQGGFEDWLRQQVAKNAPYDKMVRDLLTAPVGAEGLGGLALLYGNGQPGPLAFYAAKEFRPESLAAGTARVFLGVSVECAQCHNHPFANWKREQFWSFAAFFSGIQSQRVQDFLLPGRETPDKRELAMPGTDKVLQARFLDNTEPTWKPKAPTRPTLAEWVTSPSNPYFSRAAVNRTWAYFFGTGLVEPIDDMVGGGNTPSHAELLDLLAKEFADHQFDLKFLMRALTATRAYQFSSAGTHKGQDDPTLFARQPLRGLTAEQLFDSVAMATGYRDSGGSGDDLASAITGAKKSARAEFLTKFANNTERPTKAQTAILQALSLMNGKVIADATSLGRSETLAAVVDAPFLTTEQRIETLYLATLSRRPASRELDRILRFVQDAAQDEPARDTAYNNALADVFWTLLNSSEFTLNH